MSNQHEFIEKEISLAKIKQRLERETTSLGSKRLVDFWILRMSDPLNLYEWSTDCVYM